MESQGSTWVYPDLGFCHCQRSIVTAVERATEIEVFPKEYPRRKGLLQTLFKGALETHSLQKVSPVAPFNNKDILASKIHSLYKQQTYSGILTSHAYMTLTNGYAMLYGHCHNKLDNQIAIF